MGIEHAQLQIENGFARHRKVEVARFDDSGVDGSNGNLENAFPQGGPVDMAFPCEGWQHRVEAKVFSQGIDIGPIVVQGDAARIRMADGSQPKPVLDFAFLPVHGWQFR